MKKILLAFCLSLQGCASIIHGAHQNIGFSSNPSSATVWVDGKEKGKTPMIANLSRKSPHIVRIALDGYLPYETTITTTVSGWVWGNLVFGGIIGLAVDAMAGGLNNLTPEQVSGTLSEENKVFLP